MADEITDLNDLLKTIIEEAEALWGEDWETLLRNRFEQVLNSECNTCGGSEHIPVQTLPDGEVDFDRCPDCQDKPPTAERLQDIFADIETLHCNGCTGELFTRLLKAKELLNTAEATIEHWVGVASYQQRKSIELEIKLDKAHAQIKADTEIIEYNEMLIKQQDGQLQTKYDTLKASHEKLVKRIDALEELLVCYRIGKRPSEKLHQKLDKSKQARKEAGEIE